MAKRVIYHVLWEKKEDAWRIKRLGRKGPLQFRWIATKVEAIEVARKAAKAVQANGGKSQIIIHKKDGKIQTEYTYGEDPKRYKG